MSTLTICIIVAFCVGYLFIALESVTKVNKAAIALLMFAVCWTLLMFSPESYFPNLTGQDLINTVSSAIEHPLGSTSTTLFFLMGAMTIVEIVDQNVVSIGFAPLYRHAVSAHCCGVSPL